MKDRVGIIRLPGLMLGVVIPLIVGSTTSVTGVSRAELPRTALVADSTAEKSSVSPAPSPTPSGEGTKKNGRPDQTSSPASSAADGYIPNYFYEFKRPGFIVSHILIEHDSTGKGKISFLKKDFVEFIVDPIQLSPATQSAINESLTRLDFLNSKEEYQYEKDLSNMGNIVFRYVRDARERTVKFNWTTNKDAKALMDEYRRIGTEAVWKFALESSRANQPLESPRLLEELDGYLRRNDITDPSHLVPLLREVIDDERLPLIARNHAARLVVRIAIQAK